MLGSICYLSWAASPQGEWKKADAWSGEAGRAYLSQAAPDSHSSCSAPSSVSPGSHGQDSLAAQAAEQGHLDCHLVLFSMSDKSLWLEVGLVWFKGGVPSSSRASPPSSCH